MIIGINRTFAHEGTEYHIQAEDLGLDQRCFEVRVYDRGTVLWRKQVPYGEIVDQGLGKSDQDEAIQGKMTKTITTVQAAIAKGKLGA